MTDYEVRSDLVAFFGWRAEAVRDLNMQEIAAWRKHITSLKEIGFWPL